MSPPHRLPRRSGAHHQRPHGADSVLIRAVRASATAALPVARDIEDVRTSPTRTFGLRVIATMYDAEPPRPHGARGVSSRYGCAARAAVPKSVRFAEAPSSALDPPARPGSPVRPLPRLAANCCERCGRPREDAPWCTGCRWCVSRPGERRFGRWTVTPANGKALTRSANGLFWHRALKRRRAPDRRFTARAPCLFSDAHGTRPRRGTWWHAGADHRRVWPVQGDLQGRLVDFALFQLPSGSGCRGQVLHLMTCRRAAGVASVTLRR